MENKNYAYDLGSYKHSDEFTNIYSEALLISLAFVEYLEEGESLVKKKQENLDSQLLKLYAKDEEEGQIFEQQDHYIGSEINCTLQESFLLAATSYLYSKFEYYLIEIAKITGDLFNSQVALNEFHTKCRKNRKGISKSFEYIQVHSKISINNMEDDWRKIKKFQMIRNCIVHANGTIKSNYHDLKTYTKQNPNLSYEESSNQIKVTKQYLLEMKKTCIDFINKIMEAVWEKPRK